jgi:GYF domain 2
MGGPPDLRGAQEIGKETPGVFWEEIIFGLDGEADYPTFKSMSLYLYQNEQRTGPFSEEQVRQMLQAGTVSPDTLAWKEGIADWSPLGTFLSPSGLAIPPAPRPRTSILGLISFVFSLVALVVWAVLLIAAGLAHNAGTATKTFNMIVGFIFMLGIFLNFAAMVLGIIGSFKSRANTLAIIGASLNGFQLVGLVLLICIGLAAKHAQ